MVTHRMRGLAQIVACVVLGVALFVSGGNIANAVPVPLTFDTFGTAAGYPGENTNVTDMGGVGLGPGYSNGLTMHFVNVATDGSTTVDALVTATILNANTGFGPDYYVGTGNSNAERGFIPDYKSTTVPEPNDDLGFLYDAKAFGIAGVTFTIDFYDGTGLASGTFSTPVAVSDLELLTYDVDGESIAQGDGSTQTEYFVASYGDGLYSYALGSGASAMTATSVVGGVQFDGPGKNFPETDSSGATILRYQNTDSVTLAFGSNATAGTVPNFVFSAIDGNLSLLDDRDDFEDPVVLASLGDYVWEDLNADGIQDAGETGIAGITVSLKDSVGTVIATTTTDGSGLYEFDSLTPGDYSVLIAKNGYDLYSPKDQGGDDALDSDADTTTGQTALTTLISGENDVTWDGGLFDYASLGDYVWEDLNADGIQDAGEPGLADVTVNLLDGSGNLVASTLTDGLGNYLFPDLIPGQYELEFVLLSGYDFSPLDVGSDLLDSDANLLTGRTGLLTLTSGQDDLSWDAGMAAIPPIPEPATLGLLGAALLALRKRRS